MSEQISYGRILNPRVRNICEKAGWPNCWLTVNDKTKTGRKIKFFGNGWRVPEKVKKKITKDVTKLIEEKGLADVAKVSWYDSMSWRGPYDKLIITITEK